MDPGQFFTAPRVTIVAGKGGVGKTTVTAALAAVAARRGLSVLVVDIDGKSTLPSLFGGDESPLGYDDRIISPGGAGHGEIRARTMDPDEALLDYLEDHGLRRIAKRLSQSGAIDMVATATPGIKDVLILGKIKQLERSRTADVILVDAPAAGHAISFLRSAGGLLDAVAVGPIETQAREVLAMLSDSTRCQVMLVALPEETPVNELIDTAYSLEDDIGIALGPIVMNGLLPHLELEGIDARDAFETCATAPAADERELESLNAAATFRRHRQELQHDQLQRLSDTLPLAQLRLPFVFTADLGPSELSQLADEMVASIGNLSLADLGRAPQDTA